MTGDESGASSGPARNHTARYLDEHAERRLGNSQLGHSRIHSRSGASGAPVRPLLTRTSTSSACKQQSPLFTSGGKTTLGGIGRILGRPWQAEPARSHFPHQQHPAMSSGGIKQSPHAQVEPRTAGPVAQRTSVVPCRPLPAAISWGANRVARVLEREQPLLWLYRIPPTPECTVTLLTHNTNALGDILCSR